MLESVIVSFTLQFQRRPYVPRNRHALPILAMSWTTSTCTTRFACETTTSMSLPNSPNLKVVQLRQRVRRKPGEEALKIPLETVL